MATRDAPESPTSPPEPTAPDIEIDPPSYEPPQVPLIGNLPDGDEQSGAPRHGREDPDGLGG